MNVSRCILLALLIGCVAGCSPDGDYVDRTHEPRQYDEAQAAAPVTPAIPPATVQTPPSPVASASTPRLVPGTIERVPAAPVRVITVAPLPVSPPSPQIDFDNPEASTAAQASTMSMDDSSGVIYDDGRVSLTYSGIDDNSFVSGGNRRHYGGGRTYHRASGYGGYSRSSGTGPYYGGGHHTGSHGGTYIGGSGSSHAGGHYSNANTGNHYGHHK